MIWKEKKTNYYMNKFLSSKRMRCCQYCYRLLQNGLIWNTYSNARNTSLQYCSLWRSTCNICWQLIGKFRHLISFLVCPLALAKNECRSWPRLSTARERPRIIRKTRRESLRGKVHHSTWHARCLEIVCTYSYFLVSISLWKLDSKCLKRLCKSLLSH